jgi:hypothetical protein
MDALIIAALAFSSQNEHKAATTTGAMPIYYRVPMD